MTTRRLSTLAVTAVLLLAGCGGDDDADGEATDTPTENVAECRIPEDARNAEAPDPDPPTEAAEELVVTDLVVGCGAEIPEGSVVEVEVNYMGKAHSTGEEFDSSYARGQSIEFAVGAGRLIAGWDQGLVGMKEGGRRQLLIPGSLAYGDRGNPPDIGPDDTLVFVLDLLAVDP